LKQGQDKKAKTSREKGTTKKRATGLQSLRDKLKKIQSKTVTEVSDEELNELTKNLSQLEAKLSELRPFLDEQVA
jgi:hypothetical protein